MNWPRPNRDKEPSEFFTAIGMIIILYSIWLLAQIPAEHINAAMK